MDDSISRQAAIANAISGITREIDGEKWIRVSEVRESIKTLPSAQPEQKTGKWERHYSRPGVYADLFWHCSACGYKMGYSWVHKFKFCPECGAKMENSNG